MIQVQFQRMLDSESRGPSIPETFEGKCVLITGATGFLGKVLLQKLLWSCPGIKKIFVLLRDTETESSECRLHELMKHKAFEYVRRRFPDFLDKVKALCGDIVLENLGLSDENLERVISDVSFVFHCAANVRFDDEPRATLSINLLGVKNMLNVCYAMTKLEALVHVSTAFSFCNHPLIDECLYPELLKPKMVIDALSWMTNEQLRMFCDISLQGRPSLYHFSKAMAEIYLSEMSSTVPAIIVRPSIVTASVKYPFPGWIDNHNGPTGFIAVCGKGIVKTLLVKKDVKADWVPVDIVADTLIVAAHYMAAKRQMAKPVFELNPSTNVPIVNCTCPENNSITWMKIVAICLPYLIKYPSSEVWSVPGGTVTSCYLRHKMCLIYSHYLPAFISDTISFVTGKKPSVMNMYRRIHGVMNHLQHYTTNGFNFKSENMKKLIEILPKENAIDFNIDQSGLDWDLYMENYVLGVRRYYLSESDENLQTSRKKMMQYHYLWLGLKLVPFVGILLLLGRSHCRKMRNLLRTALPFVPKVLTNQNFQTLLKRSTS